MHSTIKLYFKCNLINGISFKLPLSKKSLEVRKAKRKKNQLCLDSITSAFVPPFNFFSSKCQKKVVSNALNLNFRSQCFLFNPSFCIKMSVYVIDFFQSCCYWLSNSYCLAFIWILTLVFLHTKRILLIKSCISLLID